jgi:signal peptidase I
VRSTLSRLPRPLEWALTIAFAVLVVLVFEAEVAKPYRIPSSSMEPTLHCARPSFGCQAHFSDRVLADRLTYRFRGPHRGEIAIFNAPALAAARCNEGGTYVKRVIGLPGEVVSERDGVVYVDGRPLDEPYVRPQLRDHRTGSWPRVPANSYFMMGDDRRFSCDSRSWGTVPRSSLIGRVLVRYWPPTRIGLP